jgi:hypothetical protein
LAVALSTAGCVKSARIVSQFPATRSAWNVHTAASGVARVVPPAVPVDPGPAVPVAAGAAAAPARALSQVIPSAGGVAAGQPVGRRPLCRRQ